MKSFCRALLLAFAFQGDVSTHAALDAATDVITCTGDDPKLAAAAHHLIQWIKGAMQQQPTGFTEASLAPVLHHCQTTRAVPETCVPLCITAQVLYVLAQISFRPLPLIEELWAYVRRQSFVRLVYSSVPVFGALHLLSVQLTHMLPHVSRTCAKQVLNSKASEQRSFTEELVLAETAHEFFDGFFDRRDYEVKIPIFRCPHGRPTYKVWNILSHVRYAKTMLTAHPKLVQYLGELQADLSTWPYDEALASHWPFWLGLHTLQQHMEEAPGILDLLTTATKGPPGDLGPEAVPPGPDAVREARVIHLLENVDDYYAGGKSGLGLERWQDAIRLRPLGFGFGPFVFIDAGAYCGEAVDCHILDAFRIWGCNAAALARASRPMCCLRAIGFEPSQNNFQSTMARLRRELRPADLRCLEIVPGGLSHVPGNRSLFGDGPAASTRALNRVVYDTLGGEDGRKPGEAEYDVKFSKLDNILAKRTVSHVDILKIDVEGAEAEVLGGAVGLLTRQRVHVVLMEYSHLWNSDFARALLLGNPTPAHKLLMPTLQGVVDTMESFGYGAYLVGGHHLLPLQGAHWHPLLEVCRTPRSHLYGLPGGGWCLFEVAFVLTGPLQRQLDCTQVWEPAHTPKPDHCTDR